MNCLRHWKERKQNRRREDNRGSSLALVVMIIAIIGILGVVLMSTALVTFRMKQTYMNSQKNFYNAESVVDAIRVGLEQDVAYAAGAAYSWTLEHYGDSDEELRRQQYLQHYEDALLARISGGVGGLSRTYSLEHLRNLVPSNVTAQAVNASATQEESLLIGSTKMISSGGKDYGYLNQDTENGTFTIKNLRVRFVDKQNYLTEIQTDIVLSCPKIDFSQKSSEPMDLTSYAFVASDRTTNRDANGLGGGAYSYRVNGNAYLGDRGLDISLANVSFQPTVDNGAGKLVTAGQLFLNNGASVKVDKGYSIWAREIYVDSASLDIDGTIYLNNDLVLAKTLRTGGVNVKLSGRLYAYGNPATAATADSFLADPAAMSLLTQYPAQYSSAILINGRNATLDMGGLEDLILAGNAYVATGKANSENSEDVQMGESIALRASQRAYLVPSQYFARYCINGGMNPMTETAYQALQDEICERFGYKDAAGQPDRSAISWLDYLRAGEDEELALPAALVTYHVTGIQKEVYRVRTQNGSVNMVYFFLKFDSEADVVNFGNSYYAQEENLSALKVRVDSDHYGTSITYPSDMVQEFNSTEPVISDFTFYYNGSVLVPDDNDSNNTKFVSGQCTKLSNLSAQALADRAREYQDTFAALCRCLLTDYSLVTTEQKGKNLYRNLVYPMTGFTGEDFKKNIPDGSMRVFSTGIDGVVESSRMCAVVKNGNYTIHETDGVAKESCPLDDGGSAELPLHLVIASGDVTVGCDFQGLIIAGGNVYFPEKNITVTADSNLAQQALKLVDADGICPVDYLINGQNYLVDGNGSGGSGYEQIVYSDYVTYSNWMKQ